MTSAAALALAIAFSASAQQPAQPDAAQQPAAIAPAQAPAAPDASVAPPAANPAEAQTPSAATASEAPQPHGITVEELKGLLVGKDLYLRGGYQDNSLNFDEHGRLLGHSPQGSFTLSAIQIEKVRILKHKIEMEGVRYGLHFVGQLAYEDSSTAFDRVRITPKKKVVKITIDREIVVKPKKVKEVKGEKEKGKGKKAKAATAAPGTPAVPGTAIPASSPAAAGSADTGSAVQAAPAQAEPVELSEADQLKASIAATPQAERPADAKSVTTTTSPAHAAQVLKEALDNVFAPGLDEHMIASLPDFWRLYYQAAAAKKDYRPTDPAIQRQNMVDQKALLLVKFEPESNEFAQANGVAGMALYHTVVGADGKAGEIAVGRPIGFGLDENAVAAIRKASFQPAVLDGKPVPVLLDLLVQFRIFSNRTSTANPPGAEPSDKPAEPVLPGPYSVPRD